MRAFKSYFLKAISNLWRNRTMSFMAMATIVFSLVLLGCSLILGNNITYISEQLEGQYEIHAYIDLSYSEEEAISLRSEIECIDFVKSAEFVSKDQALADMVASMEDARPAFEMLEGDENPLPHAFDITLTDVKKADDSALVNEYKENLSSYGVTNEDLSKIEEYCMVSVEAKLDSEEIKNIVFCLKYDGKWCAVDID